MSQCCNAVAFELEMRGNVFLNLIPSHSYWFIPIPNPRFHLVVFPFPFHYHWLFPFLPAPIPVLLYLIRKQMIGKLNHAWNSTVIERKNNQILKRYTCSVKVNSDSWTSRVNANLTVYDKLGLLCKNYRV